MHARSASGASQAWRKRPEITTVPKLPGCPEPWQCVLCGGVVKGQAVDAVGQAQGGRRPSDAGAGAHQAVGRPNARAPAAALRGSNHCTGQQGAYGGLKRQESTAQGPRRWGSARTPTAAPSSRDGARCGACHLACESLPCTRQPAAQQQQRHSGCFCSSAEAGKGGGRGVGGHVGGQLGAPVMMTQSVLLPRASYTGRTTTRLPASAMSRPMCSAGFSCRGPRPAQSRARRSGWAAALTAGGPAGQAWLPVLWAVGRRMFPADASATLLGVWARPVLQLPSLLLLLLRPSPLVHGVASAAAARSSAASSASLSSLPRSASVPASPPVSWPAVVC